MRYITAFMISVLVGCSCGAVAAQDLSALRQSLTLHASFDQTLSADFARGDAACYFRQGASVVPAAVNEDVEIAAGEGRFGNSLHFTKKSGFRPQFKGSEALGYNDRSWSATVSVWLRLNPDEDLEPGYCDPVQIIGDDTKKGFIFLEWSKDETPRFFRYAIRPLSHIWNPNNEAWDDIPAKKRPMVQIADGPFSRDVWTHAVVTVENINDQQRPSLGKLFLNGQLQGTIENWDLTLDWDPAAVQIVLGAAYVGYLDDLAVFNRALADSEVQQLYQLKDGAAMLHR